MDSYVCEWCGVLENKDEPIYEDNKKFCSTQCVKGYRKIIGKPLINKVMSGEISFLDLPKWLRDETSGIAPNKYITTAHKCVVCGRLFYSYTHDTRKCCSSECHKIRCKEIGVKHRFMSIGFASGGWEGGISYGEYCHKFNADLKNRVREFFENRCLLCGKPQKDNGRRLHVHHVNYNKNMGCDTSKVMLVPLCNECHGKTNGDRVYWENYFEDVLRDQYNYKCYYTEEEYNKLISK